MKTMILLLVMMVILVAKPVLASENQDFNQDFLKTGTLLTGTIIAGEGLALLVGMHILSSGDNPWISGKNDLLIAVDLVTGLGLVYISLTEKDIMGSTLFYILTSTALISHGYREWEYVSDSDNSFCANVPLFIVNNLKLIGLVAITTTGSGIKFTIKI